MLRFLLVLAILSTVPPMMATWLFVTLTLSSISRESRMELGLVLLTRFSAACRSQLSGTVGPGLRGLAGPATQ